MVELSISSSAHGRVVPPVDLSNLVAFDVLDLVHSHVPRERHRQVVTQGQDLSALDETKKLRFYFLIFIFRNNYTRIKQGNLRFCLSPVFHFVTTSHRFDSFTVFFKAMSNQILIHTVETFVLNATWNQLVI